MTANHRDSRVAPVNTVLTRGEATAMEKSSPVTVHVRVDFLKIGDIDTKSQKFIAEISVRLRWIDSSLTDISEEDFCQNPKSSFGPINVLFSNLEDFKWHNIMWGLNPHGLKGPEVSCYHKIKGSFFEKMELKDFPHDVQDISVLIVSENPSRDVVLLPDSDPSTVDTTNFQDVQEWHLYQHVVLESRTLIVDNEKHEKMMRTAVSATCRVARKMKFFFYNALLIMFFIISLSFTGFALSPSDVKFRLAGTLTLLLTSVAFKIALANSLPTISYLTLLDLYVLGGISYLCAMTGLFALLSIIKDSGNAYQADKIAMTSLIAFQLIWHLFYTSFFVLRTWGKKWEVKREEARYLKTRDCV